MVKMPFTGYTSPADSPTILTSGPVGSCRIVSEAKGTFVGERRVRAHMAACNDWPKGDVPTSFIEPVKSDIPVIMFSGEVDGSSPPGFGKEAVRYMPNGIQILARYYGHQLFGPCVSEVMRTFVNSASVRRIDSSCTEKIRRRSVPHRDSASAFVTVIFAFPGRTTRSAAPPPAGPIARRTISAESDISKNSLQCHERRTSWRMTLVEYPK